MAELISPFDLDVPDAVEEPSLPADTTLEEIDALLELTGKAKAEAERAKARYDTLRDRITGLLRHIGQEKIENEHYMAYLQEKKSDYSYSQETLDLEKKLKLQQEVERRHGIALPRKVTVSATFRSR